MRINISSTIIETALRGILKSGSYTFGRGLDGSIGEIFIDKAGDSGIDSDEEEDEENKEVSKAILDTDTDSEDEESTEDMNIKKKGERKMETGKIEFRCVSEEQDGSTKSYHLKGKERINFGMNDISVRAYDDQGEEIDVEESLRAINGRGRPAKYYSIEGIASSTSIDSYGTEMSYNSLMEMQDQMTRGVPLLPRHTSRLSAGDMAEWDEVIGRTYEADIRQDEVLNPSSDRDKQYSLLVRSRLYGEDQISRELVKRLRRGEPIGQSIGGWFNDMEIMENAEGEIERVIIKSVTLDHLAITRAPANPDSVGLATYSKESEEIKNILTSWRSKMDNTKTTKKVEIVDPVEEETVTANLPNKEEIQELSKTQDEVETRSIKMIEETDTSYVVHFEKYSDEMRGKVEEMMKEEDMQDMMKSVFEARMEEFIKELQEQSKMKFDDLAKSNDNEQEVRDTQLDHNSVVEEPIMDNVDNGGQDEPAPETEYEENSPFDKLDDRAVMPFNADLPIGAEDVPWSWNTTTQDEVLGRGLDNWERYAQAHLYREDGDNPETKGAYKLPIARMINGELMVIWNGCRAAMGALNGARGGVDISDQDREECYKVLSQYYAKFEKEVPELRSNEEENKKENLIEENNVILSTENIKENSMNDNDMKNLADLIGRSISEGLKPLSERIDQLESRSTSTMNEVKEVTEVKEQALPTDVQELRSIIEKQNDLIARALAEPQRTGITSGQIHRGIGATTAIERLAERSAKEGYVSLSAIVNRHKDLLSEETNLNTVSVHVLKDLLSSGLRSAEQDGLLGATESNIWS